MFYHASPIGGITRLEPRISEHGQPLVYFSTKRENVLVYLSNAVEKYCRETGFRHTGPWKKWGPYGFEQDGRLRLEEYYPDALERTCQGVSGYIYRADSIGDAGVALPIPDAAVSSVPVEVTGVEFVPDAYDAILKAERDGLITILRYEEMTGQKKEWLAQTIKNEYESAEDHPEYRHFLQGVFRGVIDDWKVRRKTL